MLRLPIIIALSASLVFLINLGFEAGQGELIPEPDISPKPVPAFVSSQGEVNFYSQVPDHPPDLNEGYLFNAERHLEGEDEPAPDDKDGLDEFFGDFDDVKYVGSIISSKSRKCIVSYPARKKKPARKRSKFSKPGLYSGKNLNYARLVVGDKFSGHKVTGVFPDKIIFDKGGETTEKLLYDTEKQRITPPAVTRKPKRFVQSPEDKKKTNQLFRKSRSRTKIGRRPLPRPPPGDH
ncbi:MAG: hypothetical protein U9O82_00415 [Thermodesulfobacteriota bacterium]|nr:hypothetical protein [Thermodesulfobacteriota bacterium]